MDDDIFNTDKAPEETKEIKLTDDEDDDPFSLAASRIESEPAAAPEVPPPAAVAPSTINIQPSLFDDSPAPSPSPPPAVVSTIKKPASTAEKLYEVDEDDEDRDQFIDIVVSDPTKSGDGMSSYIKYKITTKTNMKAFKSSEFSTNRRFSDFLNLYEKLKEKHLPAGVILPPAPEKDMIGMAKVKMSKEDTTPDDFLEKRRAALQRFLVRLAKHKKLRFDPDFRDFLEITDDLPKAASTALSGAGMLKMFKNVTDSVTKITTKIEETDPWYDEKFQQVENLYIQFKKMHNLVQMLYGWRKDLSVSTKDFAKSTSILANSEEQLTISRALQNLSDAYEKIDQIYLDQSNSDYFKFSELMKDYVCMLDNIKEVFNQRIKAYTNWQRAEETLKSKKDTKAKLEASNKQDKVPAAAAEVKDWETKVEKAKEEFDIISKGIKEEMKRFDINRIKELKTELTHYLQSLLKSQESVVKIWEQYLPQVKAI